MHGLQPHDLMIHWTMAGSASSSGRSSLRSSVSSTASFLSPLATRSYSPSTLQPLSSDLPQHLGTQAACASGSPGPPPAPIPAAPVNELAHSAASLFIYFWRDQSPLGSLLPEPHGQTLTPSMPVHASHSIPLSLREQPPVFLDCGRMTRAAVLQQDLDLGAFLTRVLATMQFCQSVIVLALLFVQKASRKRHARVFPVLSEWEVAVAGLMVRCICTFLNFRLSRTLYRWPTKCVMVSLVHQRPGD